MLPRVFQEREGCFGIEQFRGAKFHLAHPEQPAHER
jgi:hypothetical protein